MSKLLKQGQTAQPLLFLMIDSTDHLTGKTGLSPTVTISKNGGAFATPSGAVTELANGWYKVAGNATDEATLGPLLLHATGTGADPCDERYEVVAFDPQSATNLGLSGLPTANPGASGGLPTTDGSNAVKLQSGTGTGQIDFTSGVVKANLTQVNGVAAATSDGTAQAGASGSITLASGASSVNGTYIDRAITITGLTGVGQSRIITAYNGTTKVATVHRNWDTNPDNTSTYSIGATAVAASVAAGGITSASFGSGAIDATAFAQAAADKAWSTASRLLTAGTNIVLAKGTGVTGFNDIAATAIVSGGAITTSSGAVSTVTTTTTATNVTTVNGLAAGVITASSIAADAITDAKVASDVTIASVTGAVGSVTAAVALTSGERLTLAGVVRDVNNATPAANSLGAAINSAASAGDPWATTLPGAYEDGTAGSIIGTNLDAVLSERTLATAAYATAANQTTILAKTNLIPSSPAAVGSAMTLSMTQAVPTSNTAQTVGDSLNAARAQGFGKWVISGTTLTLYAGDNTTVVRTLTLNSPSSPTSRS